MAKKMVEERSWEEFRNVGLLWWINTMLHMFGWAIVVILEDDKKTISKVYPARVRFRGFSDEANTDGYIKVTEHLQQNIYDLVEEAKG